MGITTYRVPTVALLGLDQLEDDIAVALSRPAHGAQPVDHGGVEPDQAIALLVGRVLEADVAERERRWRSRRTRLG